MSTVGTYCQNSSVLVYNWSGRIYTPEELNRAIVALTAVANNSNSVVSKFAIVLGDYNAAMSSVPVSDIELFYEWYTGAGKRSSFAQLDSHIRLLISVPTVAQWAVSDEVWLYAGDVDSYNLFPGAGKVSDVFDDLADSSWPHYGSSWLGLPMSGAASRAVYSTIVAKIGNSVYMYSPSLKSFDIVQNESAVSILTKPYYYIINTDITSIDTPPLGRASCVVAPDTEDNIPLLHMGAHAGLNDPHVGAWRMMLGADLIGTPPAYLSVLYRRSYYPEYYAANDIDASLYWSKEALQPSLLRTRYSVVEVAQAQDTVQQIHDNATIVGISEPDGVRANLFFEVPVYSGPMPSDSGFAGGKALLAYQVSVNIRHRDTGSLIFQQTISAPIISQWTIPYQTYPVYFRVPITDITGVSEEQGVQRWGAFAEHNDPDGIYGIHGKYDATTLGNTVVRLSTYTNTIPCYDTINNSRAWLSTPPTINKPIRFPGTGAYTLQISYKGFAVSSGSLVATSDASFGSFGSGMHDVIKGWLERNIGADFSDLFDKRFDLLGYYDSFNNIDCTKIGGAVGVSSDGANLMITPIASADMSGMIEHEFFVTDSITNNLIIDPGLMVGEQVVTQNPTIRWHWQDAAEAPNIDYYVFEAWRNGVSMDLGNDIGKTLYTDEMSFQLLTDATPASYTIRVRGIPVDQPFAYLAEKTFALSPVSAPELAVSNITLTCEVEKPRFQPIRLLCYNQEPSSESPGYYSPDIEGADKTDWQTLTPPVLNTYNGILEFYYSDGKIYTNADLRSVAKYVIIIYYRLYDFISLELDLERSNEHSPRVYGYTIACSPDVFTPPPSQLTAPSTPTKRPTVRKDLTERATA